MQRKGIEVITFENNGEIDPRTIKTMGVNVKVSDSPIGFFGTGLKYAIATLLRNSCSITIWSGTDAYEFSFLAAEIRGEKFDVVTMNGEELGFTTNLGRKWEMWMAYRELYSNCLDEGGDVTTENPLPEKGRTMIQVTGAIFETVHHDRHLYFISSRPLVTGEKADIHQSVGGGLFYRGVRVSTLDTLYSYNLSAACDLTDDRTLKYGFEAKWHVQDTVMRCHDRDLIQDILTARAGTFETELEFKDASKFSPEFMEVAESLVASGNAHLNGSAKKALKTILLERLTEGDVVLSDMEQIQYSRAVEFCKMLGFNVTKYPVLFCSDLGAGIHGLAKDRKIYIDEECFRIGTKYLAQALIEEFIHLSKGFKDETREMQNYLFETVTHLGEQIKGKPL